MFNWLERRRRRHLRRTPFPAQWLTYVLENVPYFSVLPPEDQEELLGHVRVLLDEKHFEGCRAFDITDEVRVTIAGHAACLLLHRVADYFPKLRTILVYPSLFLVEDHYPDEDGIVSTGADEHAGQSWDLGAVVLAWDEVVRSSNPSREGYNVVLHEFAHQLDLADHFADGTPSLRDEAHYERWIEVFKAGYDDLIRDVRRGRRTVIDEYGATSEAEFFAVATEAFFETPLRLRRKHPDLYGELSAYFRQDPADLVEKHR